MRRYITVMVVLVSLHCTPHPIEASTDCPCVAPQFCETLPPYGTRALDILLFGSHGPCLRYGDIRCCPRTYLSSKGALGSSNFTVEEDLQECGCLPKGLCSDGFQTQKCKGGFEMCCVSTHQNMANLLKPPTPSKESAFERPSPVFIKLNSSNSSRELNCVARHLCKKVYGEDSLDVSIYGSLVPCLGINEVYCIELIGNSSKNPDESSSLLPHIPMFVSKTFSEKVLLGIIFDFNNQTLLDILRAKPIIQTETFTSQPDTETEQSNSFNLKSIPPQIYYDENGTLVISGGSPVVYLPTPPQPIDLEMTTPAAITTTFSIANTQARPIYRPVTVVTYTLNSAPPMVETSTIVINTNPEKSTDLLIEDNHSTLLKSALNFFESITNFFLQKNETQVTLSNQDQQLSFKVQKDSVVKLLQAASQWEIQTHE